MYTQIYLVAFRARMNSLKSMVPLLSSSNILNRASTRNGASSPRTFYNINNNIDTHLYSADLRELKELCLGDDSVRADQHEAGVLGPDDRLRQAGPGHQTGHLAQ